jgi:hypothetical protein
MFKLGKWENYDTPRPFADAIVNMMTSKFTIEDSWNTDLTINTALDR